MLIKICANSLWLKWRHVASEILVNTVSGNGLLSDDTKPLQRPVTRSFDVFFGLCLNKRLSKQSLGWWYETPSRWLWGHCNEQRLTEFRTWARNYRKTSNISRTLVGNKIADNSDVVGASPVGAAPTTSSFSTWHLASMDWAKTTARGYKKHLSFGIWCDLY